LVTVKLKLRWHSTQVYATKHSFASQSPEGLQRSSEANLKHGWQGKDKLAAQRHAAKVGIRVMGELKLIEQQLVDAGLVTDD
jgi:hypothetical protein